MNWQNVAAYKNPALFNRCINKHLVSSEDEFEHLFTELKKFAYLASINPYRSLPMLSKKVDEIWHEFILLTKDYSSFCQNCLGMFLHHDPTTSQDTEQKNSQEFFDLYRDQFGTIPSAWMRCDGSCNGSCSADCDSNIELNQHFRADCESSGE